MVLQLELSIPEPIARTCHRNSKPAAAGDEPARDGKVT